MSTVTATKEHTPNTEVVVNERYKEPHPDAGKLKYSHANRLVGTDALLKGFEDQDSATEFVADQNARAKAMGLEARYEVVDLADLR